MTPKKLADIAIEAADNARAELDDSTITPTVEEITDDLALAAAFARDGKYRHAVNAAARALLLLVEVAIAEGGV